MMQGPDDHDVVMASRESHAYHASLLQCTLILPPCLPFETFLSTDASKMKCVMLIASALLAAAVAQQMAASPPRVDLGDAPEDDGSVAPSGTRARRVVGLDNTDKDAVLALFNDEYLGSSNDKYTWTGDIGDCDSGSNSAAHKKQVLKRVNYFRTMVR